MITSGLHRAAMTRAVVPVALCLAMLPATLLRADPFGLVDVTTLDPQVLIETATNPGWREMPDALRGSLIHEVSNGHPTGIDGGVIDFDVTQTGLIYLACFWGYGGNPSGGWTDERLFMDDMIALGWSYQDDMKHQNGSRYRLMSKTVTVGEQYHVRVNKYAPPLAVTLTAESGTLSNPLPPWPLFGSLRVADFDPTDLVIGNEDHPFIDIPAPMEGQTIYSDQRRIPGGELEFEVVSDTTVRMAAHFGYEGNSQGDWDEYRMTLADLLGEGWTDTGFDMLASGGGSWDVLQKSVLAGERYNIRVNKYSTPLLMTVPVIGDINGDGVVNVSDLGILAGFWGMSGTIADLDGDDVVGVTDLGMMAHHWTGAGGGGSLSSATVVPVPSAALAGLGLISAMCSTRRRRAAMLQCTN